MTTSDDDRISYLAGEDAQAVTPRERAELDELRALLKGPAVWEQPDPDLEDRIVTAITEEARGRSASAGARRAPRLRRPAWRRPAWRRPAWRRPGSALAGFAIAAIAIAAIVALTISSTPRAPQQFAMVISGTTLAPTASGSATLTKTGSGWRIALSATGLPRLANGRYYEAWLKNAAGVLVPVGTFNEARDVTLWAGVPVPEFPGLTVTRQRANGNPASSGQRVLTGTIRTSH